VRHPETTPPAWLAHPLRWQRGPVPWAAMARGALGMGPLLAAGIATGHQGASVLAGLGAMFAGINDRPGTRRTGIPQIGIPALGGAAGLLLGVATGWCAVPLLALVGLVSGAISVAGPVSSAAAVQLLVLTAVGSGMPLGLPGWAKAGSFLAGAGWILLMRVLSRRPGRGHGRHHGERLAVAAVFDALADALAAVGGPDAQSARRRLTTALDRADEALRLHRLLRLPRVRLHTPVVRPKGRRFPAGGSSKAVPGARRAETGRLDARFAAAAALCEASVALLWEGEPLPERITVGPRRLAAAVRADANPGALPAPVSDTAARTAFDRAVLEAGLAFSPGVDGEGSGGGRRVGTTERTAEWNSAGGRGRAGGRGLRPTGPAGREYGLRVAVCVAASTAVALLLRTGHWYWLPATAAFLVKPDYGPLFSRVVNRFAGTAAGVLLFAVAGVVGAVPGGRWWPAVAVTAAGALIPLALRHFGLQTAVITVTVLAFVTTGGDTQAAPARLADTAIACAIVLLVGHLPRLIDTRARVGHRSAHALRRTQCYLDHILTAPADQQHPVQRDALRRAAYHALADARTAAETAAAELRAGPDRDWLRVTAGAERIADAATACAVRLEHGAPRPAEPAARQVTDALAAVADALDGRGPDRPPLGAAPADCRTLDDILTELHRIRLLTTG